MKKLAILLFCIVAVWTIKNISSYQNKVSSLLLYNIEALAADESMLPTQCLGSGSVDCPASHDKVKYVFQGYSLK